MAKSRDLLGKFGKIIEMGISNYKDLSSEIINICKSKRNDFIFKMKITGKEETEILKKRIEKIENRLDTIQIKKKIKKVKRSVQ